MSLIEKIDAEIAETEKYAKEYIGINKREVLLCASSKISMANYIKQIVLSEQKEPCEYCKEPHGQFLTDGLFDQCRVQALQMFGTEKYKYTLCVNNSAFKEINYCPICGRRLNPSTT